MGKKGNLHQESGGTKRVEFFLVFFFFSNSGPIHHAKRGSLTGCELGGCEGGSGMDDSEQRSIIISIQ